MRSYSFNNGLLYPTCTDSHVQMRAKCYYLIDQTAASMVANSTSLVSFDVTDPDLSKYGIVASSPVGEVPAPISMTMTLLITSKLCYGLYSMTVEQGFIPTDFFPGQVMLRMPITQLEAPTPMQRMSFLTQVGKLFGDLAANLAKSTDMGPAKPQ